MTDRELTDIGAVLFISFAFCFLLHWRIKSSNERLIKRRAGWTRNAALLVIHATETVFGFIGLFVLASLNGLYVRTANHNNLFLPLIGGGVAYAICAGLSAFVEKQSNENV